MSTVSKYWDKYRERHRSESIEKTDIAKLAGDKQAYISFLEVQLERVTQTVLTTQGFNDRIESLQTQLNSSDDKIINLTRLVKLQQTFAESQEEEINNLKKALGSGLELKPSSSNINNLERRFQSIEERLDMQKSKDPNSKYEDFVSEINSALKTTENKITDLLSKVTEEMESKQKKYQRTIENSLQQYTDELNTNYKELSLKLSKAESNLDIKSRKSPDFENSRSLSKKAYSEDQDQYYQLNDRMAACEKSIKDLEQFLVAVAEEVKKVEEQHLDTSDIEYRIGEKLNFKVEKLAGLVKKALGQRKEVKKAHEKSADKIEISPESKESPKFPNTHSSAVKSFQEDLKPRQKSKESESSNSRERSKSPKSITSRQKKSGSSSRTPKSKHSNSSSRTPKSGKSLSPNATPPNRKKNLSPVPKASLKSKTIETSLKQKIKSKDFEDKKQTLKKEEKKKPKKKSENKSKLDKLYQELSGKTL